METSKLNGPICWYLGLAGGLGELMLWSGLGVVRVGWLVCLAHAYEMPVPRGRLASVAVVWKWKFALQIVLRILRGLLALGRSLFTMLMWAHVVVYWHRGQQNL